MNLPTRRPAKRPSCNDECRQVGRRGFLQAATASAVTLTMAEIFGTRVFAQDAQRAGKFARFPRLQIARLSDVESDRAVEFNYPDDSLHTLCLLMKLTGPASGGIGPQQNVVAFSSRCTHMGGDLSDGWSTAHNVLGCSEHLTTFDLTRHGMVVAGHATESLPQVVLEHDPQSDLIYATGLIGLLYGHHVNPGLSQEEN